jgi:hypothetical protein
VAEEKESIIAFILGIYTVIATERYGETSLNGSGVTSVKHISLTGKHVNTLVLPFKLHTIKARHFAELS